MGFVKFLCLFLVNLFLCKCEYFYVLSKVLSTKQVTFIYFSYCRDMDKMDDLGWKAKLNIPPTDKRIKTSVSIP